jgi:uncharacterized protein YbaR (Trm112 family)
MIDPFVLSVLVDPVDRGPLVYIEADNVLFNPRRQVAYDVSGGIPVMVPDEAKPVSDADAARYNAAN